MMGVVSRPRKRLFLALILVSLLLAALSGYGLWKVSFLGLANISAILPFLLGGLLVAIVLAITAGIAGIVLAILGFQTPSLFLGVAWSAINLLFPLAISLGKLFDIEKERIERSFIEVSNHLVRQKHIQVKPERLLILTPHCIQNESCPHKITRDASNCRECGKCRVGDLVALSREYGVHLAVVTGGTLARKVVKTLRPQAILAIACERDLTTGIQDVFPLPAVGILNERPEGPCCNTSVDIARVEKAIKDFLNEPK
ncbi:MAG: DUF116 domain-containing protein [Negativicutes bacterium]|nr:DUF116 domain-containing protein [Negativicutes bacterium]